MVNVEVKIKIQLVTRQMDLKIGGVSVKMDLYKKVCKNIFFFVLIYFSKISFAAKLAHNSEG